MMTMMGQDPALPPAQDVAQADSHRASALSASVNSKCITDEGSVPPILLDCSRFIHAATGGVMDTAVLAAMFPQVDLAPP